YFANSSTSALAREVIEAYGEDLGRHPVGTGAYMLRQYVPRSKIILEANPDYRGFVWNFTPSGEAWDEQIVRDMKGKQMPRVGGYSTEKIALRRALAMAYSYNDEIRQVWFGQAVKAQSTIPPGVAGFDPNYRNSIAYDPELAAKLLDRFGYKKGADGWRTMPDGKPLVIRIHSDQRTRDIAKMEIWKRSLDRINVHTDFPVSGFA